MNTLKQIALLAIVTFIPALELRASIPFGILGGSKASVFGIESGLLSWPMVVAVCTIANILLGWAVFFVLAPVMKWLERMAWFRKVAEPVLLRMQAKLKPYVEKYGEFGVAIFIGIPLPGSGVYTGAVGAFLLGLDRRKFAVANVLGVLIAAAAVTAVTLTVRAGVQSPWLDWMLKH